MTEKAVLSQREGLWTRLLITRSRCSVRAGFLLFALALRVPRRHGQEHDASAQFFREFSGTRVLRRIASAERSRGASAKAQFTCSMASIGTPKAGSRRIRNTARPPIGTGLKAIGDRLEWKPWTPAAIPRRRLRERAVLRWPQADWKAGKYKKPARYENNSAAVQRTPDRRQ